MRIKSFRAKDFRNLKEISFEADNKMNVICGENAQGKTNILEALWLFTGAKSFRNSADSSFINFSAGKAKTEIIFENGKTEYSAQMEFGEKRTAFLNEKSVGNPAGLAGNLRAVIFSPNDLGIIKDGPEKRRRFIDVSVGQLYPQYIDILRNYIRAVKQRNAVIKDLKYDASIEIMLDSFENEIAVCGEKIIKYRKNYIELLSNYLPEIYGGISSGREEIMSVYVANVCDNIKESLKESRKTDCFTGTTSVGPHRDDILFKINGVNVRSYGSQGQKRSVALSLKLAGAEVINAKTGEYPVCLLDDVMSELDENRQSYVLNHIKNQQSFITCCDPANISRLKEGKIIKIKNGEII